MSRAVPLRGLLHRLLQHPAAQLRDARAAAPAPAVVGRPHELGRGEEDALRRAPAGLRAHRGDAPAAQLHDGLVQQGELALVQRRAQPGGQLGAAHHVGLHLRRVHLDAALPGLFRAVHREVGVAHQLAGGGPRLREGDADAGRDAHLGAPFDLVGLGESQPQPVGDLVHAVFARRVVAGAVAEDERGELVASEPGRAVPGPYGLLKATGRADQQLVACLVPDGVVHRLEAVEVDEEHGGARVGGAAAAQRLFDLSGEQRPVGQVGQRVVLGVVL